MQQQTVTLVVGGFGILGTLTAAFGGHILTRSWQREQWARDKRLQDYQDVMSAITSAYMAFIRLEQIRATSHFTQELSVETTTISMNAYRIIRDRIFIAEELERGEIFAEWDEVVRNLRPNATSLAFFSESFLKLHSKLVRMALNSPKRSWSARMKARRS